MPISRRGLVTPADRGKGTFAIAAENRRLAQMQQQQERHGQESVHRPLNPSSTGPVTGGPKAKSQFGKPLGGGSSLTQKLHGTTLGSHQRSRGHGVGVSVGSGGDGVADLKSPGPTQERKFVYAGMTPGSRQVKSGVSAAVGVHEMKIYNHRLKDQKQVNPLNKSKINVAPMTMKTQPQIPPPPPLLNKPTPDLNSKIPIINKQAIPSTLKQPMNQALTVPTNNGTKVIGTSQNSTITQPTQAIPTSSRTLKASVPPPPPGHEMTVVPKIRNKSFKDPTLTEEERQERRERRRIRKIQKRQAEMRQKQIIIQQQQQQQR